MKAVRPQTVQSPSAERFWAAEFLLRGGESREILGSWIRSGKVPEAKKRRVKQVITCSFPCGKWLHRIGARASPKCELCRREREARGASIDSLPQETVAHIQSAGCNLQKKSVIGAHNHCWKYLIGAISTHGEANRSLEILGGDKDRQLHTLWKETNIGKILPWDDIEEEAEELIAKKREGKQAWSSDKTSQQRDDELIDDEKEPSEEVIFGQSRPGLTLWQLIGTTRWCMSWSSSGRLIKEETTVKKGKHVQRLSMTC